MRDRPDRLGQLRQIARPTGSVVCAGLVESSSVPPRPPFLSLCLHPEVSPRLGTQVALLAECSGSLYEGPRRSGLVARDWPVARLAGPTPSQLTDKPANLAISAISLLTVPLHASDTLAFGIDMERRSIRPLQLHLSTAWKIVRGCRYLV